MLLTALQQHSEIYCLSEIFVPEHFKQSYIPSDQLNVKNVIDSLSRSRDKKILGFSVLYNELFHSRFTEAPVDELVQQKFRVIHVVRDNLLRRFLSHKIASSTKVWTDSNGHNPSTLKVKVSYRDLFVNIKQTLEDAERVRVVFCQRPLLELSYETLCIDFSRNCARVCKGLGASYENRGPKTFKQENHSLREAITNYNRLKCVFAVTKYKRCFDE